jgi:hypothetical protein
LIVAWGNNVLELSPSLNGGEELKPPETIAEKSVEKHGQGMYPETTILSSFVAD